MILSVLTVTANKPALYTCLASNKHSAGANTVKATARVTVAGRNSLLFPFHNEMQKNGAICTSSTDQLPLLRPVLCQLPVVLVVSLQLFLSPICLILHSLTHPYTPLPQSSKHTHTLLPPDHTYCPCARLSLSLLTNRYVLERGPSCSCDGCVLSVFSSVCLPSSLTSPTATNIFWILPLPYRVEVRLLCPVPYTCKMMFLDVFVLRASSYTVHQCYNRSKSYW